MVQGLAKRDASETNPLRSLQASAEVPTVSLPRTGGPGASPRLPSIPDESRNPIQQALSGFRQYANEAISNAATRNQERSRVEGQMAHLQGRSFEEVEMEGDKHALAGYRVVEAQERASALLTAQQAEIAQGLFELNPDEYRTRFADRVEGLMSTITDERTRELAMEQITKQMPVLVDQHLVEHLQWQEQRGFDTLARSVDTISSDPTAASTLLDFARGAEGTATSGLSEGRRQEAVVSGVVRAFENDNPAAYAILASEGFLSELPVAQQRSIRAAKASFEQRARNTYNADFIKDQEDLTQRIATGELEPEAAMEAYAQLLADYNITINQQEAGAVYSQAQDGVRTRKINTAAATAEALQRGERDTAVNLIMKSLTRTESSGNTGAIYKGSDGREFGGLLQLGSARLTDYARATGTEAITPEQFRNLRRGEQEVVNRWHLNDILDHIESRGYGELVGTSINGTTVSISGLVAVAHLGGKGGLDKFVRTKGEHNPSDELGTSLTDYMRKHGNGVDLTPEQARAAANNRIQLVREQAAIATYEEMQPQLDAINEAYEQGGINEDVWREALGNVYEQYNQARTMADAKFEMDFTRAVKDEAENQLKEAESLAVGAAVLELDTKFEEAVRKYEKGEINQAEMLNAQNEYTTGRRGVMEKYGIKLSANDELQAMRAQVNRLDKAMRARLTFDQEQGEINAAIRSGTLMELPSKLRDRAVKQHRQRVEGSVQDAIASKQITAEQAGDLQNAMMVDYYAETGLVDQTMERTMNGFLAGGLIDPQGNPRPEYVEAAEQYRQLFNRNPTLADKYVRPEHRDTLDAVLNYAGSGPLEGAIASVGRRKDLSPRTQTTEDFLASARTNELIDRSISDYLAREEIGVAQATFTRDADLQQVMNRSWFDEFGIDDSVNQTIIRERMRSELAAAHGREPNISAGELVSSVGRRVQERSPILGGNVVALPLDGPSAGEYFFGARAADFDDQAGAINDVVMDFFRTPEFREQFPFVDDTVFRDFLPDFIPDEINLPLVGAVPIQGEAMAGSGLSTSFTGVRPFKMYFDDHTKTFQVQFALPGRGSFSEAIVLDARGMGQWYMNRHNAAASNRDTNPILRSGFDRLFGSE